MDKNNAVTVIEKLTEICKDGEKGYKDAADHAKRSDLKTFFATQSSERGRFARELQAVLLNLGKMEKKESGTVAGTLHRAWIDTKVGLGAGDKSILGSVETAARCCRYSEPTGPQCSSRPRPSEESTGRDGRINHTLHRYDYAGGITSGFSSKTKTGRLRPKEAAFRNQRFPLFQEETHADRSNKKLRSLARCFYAIDDRLQQGGQHRFELQNCD